MMEIAHTWSARVYQVAGNILLSAIIVSISMFSLNANAAAGATSPDSVKIRELLEERDREIKELLGPKDSEYTQQQRDRLKDIINSIVDYRTMASKALQNTFDTLSTEQRNEFVDLFSQVVRDQSLNKLDIYRAQVSYRKIAVENDSAFVKTTAQLEDMRTPVFYNMQKQEDEWVVTDMVIDEVSTVASYRRSFQNIIRKKGFDHLLATLRKRVAD